MKKSSVAAYVFNALVTVVILFQIALALGAPWGELTWGGRFQGALPASMRVACVFSALLMLAFGMVVSVRAGLLLSKWRATSRKLVWVVALYCALGVIANGITPSYWERMIWLPVVVILLACCVIVARAE